MRQAEHEVVRCPGAERIVTSVLERERLRALVRHYVKRNTARSVGIIWPRCDVDHQLRLRWDERRNDGGERAL